MCFDPKKIFPLSSWWTTCDWDWGDTTDRFVFTLAVPLRTQLWARVSDEKNGVIIESFELEVVRQAAETTDFSNGTVLHLPLPSRLTISRCHWARSSARPKPILTSTDHHPILPPPQLFRHRMAHSVLNSPKTHHQNQNPLRISKWRRIRNERCLLLLRRGIGLFWVWIILF